LVVFLLILLWRRRGRWTRRRFLLLLLLLFLFQLLDLLFHVLIVVFRFFVLRLGLERLLIMLERVFPIGQLLVVALFRFAALVKCVAEVVMARALQIHILGEQCLAE